MYMLPHHVELRTDADGHPAVEVTFDVTAVQAGSAAHAVRVVRDARYRTADMSVEDVLAMREMTSLADELADIEAAAGTDRVRASVARLGVLRSALEQFAAADHLEREGDGAARSIVYGLVDAVADLHAEAIRAALSGEPEPAGNY